MRSALHWSACAKASSLSKQTYLYMDRYCCQPWLGKCKKKEMLAYPICFASKCGSLSVKPFQGHWRGFEWTRTQRNVCHSKKNVFTCSLISTRVAVFWIFISRHRHIMFFLGWYKGTRLRVRTSQINHQSADQPPMVGNKKGCNPTFSIPIPGL